MASNGSQTKLEDPESSLEKIKRQLTSGSGRNILQGPLYKRSETLRKWNERWMILDPTTGKMEYKVRRSDGMIKGKIIFDTESTILVSPVNFQGIPKYDGCCFYIGTPQKKEYFLCAETPSAASAWVDTLRAAQLVLKAHKEAVNSLGGSSSSSKLGTVATVVAAANSTAAEASKQIESAMKISMRAALGKISTKSNEGELDDLSIMKETLRVKDEELQHLSRELRARDSTIKELAEKLTDTAEAAESAASAAHAMDEERRLAFIEIDRLTSEAEKQSEAFSRKLKETDEKVAHLNKGVETVLKQRDSAFQETQLWRSELGKAREKAVILEAAVLRAEERARVAEADAETKLRTKDLIHAKEKEELLSYLAILQSQIQSGRQEEASTKHIDLSEGDVDKACLNSGPRSTVDSNESGGGDVEWGDLQSASQRMDDVKEISTEGEDGSSHDIPVVVPSISDPPIGGPSFQP